MRWAASTVMLSGPDWADRLGELAEAGCESIELWAGFGPDTPGHPSFNYTDPYSIERAARGIERAGLRVHSMHGPMSLRPPRAGEPFGAWGLDELLEALRAAIDAVVALGGRFVVTQDPAESAPPDAPRLAATEPLARLADCAAERGCVFCVETGAEDADRFERLAGLVRRMGHRGLGVCIDTGHTQVWAHRDVPRAIRACGATVRTCHLHDNVGDVDSHLAVGDGIVPWRAVAAAFAETGYRGPLVIESHAGPKRGSPAEVIARSRSLLESVVTDAWRPVATVAGCDVFPAGASDRERAALVLGADRVPGRAPVGHACRQAGGHGGRAMIAVDASGDPAAWVEVEASTSIDRLHVATRTGAPEGLAAGMVALLVEGGQAEGGAS